VRFLLFSEKHRVPRRYLLDLPRLKQPRAALDIHLYHLPFIILDESETERRHLSQRM
jgi:hypothetical protein